MGILDVDNLSKSYSAFDLKNVSFSLEEAKITGLIGRNGAGKSTTLKSILGFVHPDAGSVKFFDMDYEGNEMMSKLNLGFVSGGVNYYGNKKLKTITNVTKSFYSNWDEAAYERYMKLFKLDELKTPSQLSEGMKVKYALTLALSHNAKLLILDEPTSGLDPVSRDELLDIFIDLCDKGVTILFSTHITSDLDKCADNIIYIKEGSVIACDDIKTLIDSFRLVEINKDEKDKLSKDCIKGIKRTKEGYTVLIDVADSETVSSELGRSATIKQVDLEDIMVHIEREEQAI